MNLSMRHNPKVLKALNDYQVKLLESDKKELKFKPTIEATQVSNNIEVKDISSSAPLYSLNTQNKAHIDIIRTGGQLSAQHTLSYNNQHKSSSVIKLQAHQPIFGNNLYTHRIAYNKLMIERAEKAVSFENALLNALNDTSKLYNKIVKLNIQAITLQRKYQKALKEIKATQIKVKSGEKTLNDVLDLRIKASKARLKLLGTETTRTKAISDLKTATGLQHIQDLDVTTKHNLNTTSIPKRFKKAINSKTIKTIIETDTELSNIAKNISNSLLQRHSNYYNHYPEASINTSWSSDNKKIQANLNISIPLDQRHNHLDSILVNTHLAGYKQQFLERCQDLQQSEAELKTVLTQEKATLLLEIQTINQEQKRLQNLVQSHRSGEVSTFELVEKEQDFTETQLSWFSSTANFFNQLNTQDIQHKTFITTNHLNPPKEIKAILSLARQTSIQIPTRAIKPNNTIDCHILINQLLK
ncbi:MAG: TolC family protein [Pseudomonadota bacterium]|nr:TolC family protein [Pseudomonadota bacterium]